MDGIQIGNEQDRVANLIFNWIIKEQVLVGFATVKPDRIVLPVQRSFACFSGVLPRFRQKTLRQVARSKSVQPAER